MADRTAATDCGGIAFVTVILLFVALFIWPGVFRYDTRTVPEGLIRIDRLTHEVQRTDMSWEAEPTGRWTTVVERR